MFEHRYAIAVDGNPFIETNDEALIERTVEVALRNGRHHEVVVEDREEDSSSTYRVERRVSVERRTGVERRAS